MSNDIEQQQVVIALINDDDDQTKTKTDDRKNVQRCSIKKFCTEDYIVPYGVPILIGILIIFIVGLVIFYAQRYNANCLYKAGVTCRGIQWIFT
jgi:hypothetical protein